MGLLQGFFDRRARKAFGLRRNEPVADGLIRKVGDHLGIPPAQASTESIGDVVRAEQGLPPGSLVGYTLEGRTQQRRFWPFKGTRVTDWAITIQNSNTGESVSWSYRTHIER